MAVIDFSRCLSTSRAVAILTNSPFALLPATWQQIWSSAVFRCATDGAANHLRPFCEFVERKFQSRLPYVLKERNPPSLAKFGFWRF